MQRVIQLLGACSGWGAKKRECEKGPIQLLLEGHLAKRLQEKGLLLRKEELIYPKVQAFEQELSLSDVPPILHSFNWRLAEAVRQGVKRGDFPIVLGGDHANAVGTWNGVGAPLGLLWIDAHMDAHTPETTPSGAYHGMPLAALLGYGDPTMAELFEKEPLLQPKDVVLFGVRSFEEGEAALLKKLNVRIYLMEEIRKRGLEVTFQEALSHVKKNTPRFGVSLDLDVFDPLDAPGVGSPEPNGLFEKEFLPQLCSLKNDSQLVALEIVEYNPEEDLEQKTEELVFQILSQVLL